MHSSKQSKSSYQIKKLPSGLLQVSCQGRKHRKAIHFGVGFDENGLGIFEKVPQKILDVFEIEPSEGSFSLPTTNELMDSYRVLEEECMKLRSAEPSSRSRRIRKQRQLQEQKHVITYSHIRKLYSEIGLTMTDIADHFKMSRVTIRKILGLYKKSNANVAELDATIINRSKSNKKYSNESDIVNFMKSASEQKDFKGVVSVSFMIEILKARFGPSYDFRRSKVSEMM